MSAATSEPFDFDKLRVTEADEFLTPDDPDPSSAEPDYDQPSPLFVDKPKRPTGALAYERKIKGALQTGFRLSVTHPATVADGAAILMYGPPIAERAGDLAAQNKAFARAVDFVSEGNESPVAAMIVAVAPFLLQVVRNHEPVLEPASRGFHIPFTKRRINFRFGIRLGRVRNLTNDPDALTQHVFSNPAIVASLKKQGINVATPSGRGRRRREP